MQDVVATFLHDEEFYSAASSSGGKALAGFAGHQLTDQLPPDTLYDIMIPIPPGSAKASRLLALA